jgi:hypothetical protein
MRTMSLAPLNPPDRNALSQLRVLLRGDHNLTVQQEEDLVAAFLAGRESAAPAVAPVATRRLPVATRDHGLPLYSAILQTGVIGGAAFFSLCLALSSGSTLFDGLYDASREVAAVAGLAGLLLLMLLPLRVMLGHRLTPAAEYVTTAVSSVLGATLLESAFLHWPTYAPDQSIRGFVIINLLAMFVAGVVVAGALGYAVARRPVRTQQPAERMAAAYRPRLAGRN